MSAFDSQAFDTLAFSTDAFLIAAAAAFAAWLGAYGIQNLRVGGVVVSKAYLGGVQVI